MGQRVLGREIVGRVRLAHVRGEPIGRYLDALDTLGMWPKVGEDVFQRIQRRIDRVAAGT